MPVLIRPQDYEEKSIDDAAIDRIVAAVEGSGRKEARAPRGLDRGKLAADLNRCWYQYESAKYAGGARDQREAAEKRLTDIAECASRLRDLLYEDDVSKPEGYANWNLAQHYGYRDFSKLDRSLQELEGSAVHTRDWQYDKSELHGAPLKDLLGFLLPLVYQEHFKKKPKRGRVCGIATSPYIRFALAVGQEFGQSLSRETIYDYLPQDIGKFVLKD